MTTANIPSTAMHVHRSEVGSAEAAQGHRSPWHKQALIWAEQDRTGRSLKHKNYERCSLLQTPRTSPIAVSQSWLTTSTVDFTCIDFMSWSKAKDDLVINLPFLQSRFQGTLTVLEMTLPQKLSNNFPFLLKNHPKLSTKLPFTISSITQISCKLGVIIMFLPALLLC